MLGDWVKERYLWTLNHFTFSVWSLGKSQGLVVLFFVCVDCFVSFAIAKILTSWQWDVETSDP